MEDKVVLIVGGTGGIGRASADLFARAGAKVVLAARNKRSVERRGGKEFRSRWSPEH